MSEIRPPLITNDPFSPWASSVKDKVRESSIIQSSDMSVGASPFGNYIGVRNEVKYPMQGTLYEAEFNITASYQVGDIIRVLPDKVYSLPWDDTPLTLIDPTLNATTSVGLIDGTPYTLIATYIPTPGVYVCTYPVPPLWFGLSTFWGGTSVNIATGKFSDLTTYIQENIYSLRFLNVNYFPVYPEPANKAILDPTDLRKLNGRYWDFIGQFPVTSSGVNYRGTYSDGVKYHNSDIVRVQTGNSQGIWINVKPNGSTGVAPVFPEPSATGGTNTWDMFAFGIQLTSICTPNGGNAALFIQAQSS